MNFRLTTENWNTRTWQQSAAVCHGGLLHIIGVTLNFDMVHGIEHFAL